LAILQIWNQKKRVEKIADRKKKLHGALVQDKN
jgi:hypothetical protein